MLTLYHYTSTNALRAIAEHGLTVGDVPTSLAKNKGICGVWLTDAYQADNLGLDGSRFDKKACRLTVLVPENSPFLHRWVDWAKSYVEPSTIKTLAENAGASKPEGWFIFLGWLRPETIIKVEDAKTNISIEDWQTHFPIESARRGVKFRDRNTWHKRLLRQIGKGIRSGAIKPAAPTLVRRD